MTPDRDIALIRRCIEIAEAARAAGDHPFGALLADARGEVVIEAGNAFASEGGPGHAEAIVARQAAKRFSPAELAGMTLVTSVEPCVMCAGAAYWAGIGVVVFGLTESRLAELTGDDPQNLTMNMPCRTVFAACRRPVQVRGPYPELEAGIVATHDGFWNARSGTA